MRSLFLFLAIASTASAQPKGTLQTDSFIRGSSGLPSTISVTYVPSDPASTAKATVHVVTSSDVSADPARLELEPNAATPVRLQFRTIDFAEESVTLQSSCCPSVKVVIEPGANHQIAITTPSDVTDREEFMVTVSATDAEGKALKCREALEVYLATAGGQIRRDDGSTLAPSATAHVGPGNVLTARFRVRPAAFFGGRGELNAQLRTTDGTVLLAKTSPFTIATSQFNNFLATILGALLWTFIRIFTTKPPPATTRFAGRAAEVAVAILSGIAAFVLALGLEKADLGLAVDKTRPWGFAVIGLLISFGGVEAIIRRSWKGDPPKEQPIIPTENVVDAIADLRRTIDKRVLGKDVDDSKSLYSFIEKHVNPLYAGAQREEENVVVTCTRAGEEAEFNLFLETTLTPPSFAATIDPITIRYQELRLPKVTTAEEARQQQLVSFMFEVAGIRYTSNPERTLMLPTGKTPPADFPPSIPIDVKIGENKTSISFGFQVDVPPSMRSKPFSYKSETVWRRSTAPDFFTWAVFRPTRVFNFDCHFPDDVLIQADSFSLTSTTPENLIPAPKCGSAHISVRDWLLPGHGVVVMWSSLAGPKSAA